MTDDRRLVLARVRAALRPLAQRAPLPDYPDELPVADQASGALDVEAVFRVQLTRAGGRVFTEAAALRAWLCERGARLGYFDPRLPATLSAELAPLTLETTWSRARIDSYDFAVTPAAGAIAETGSIVLDDASTSRRLATVAPWVHVAVVSRAAIRPRVVDALRALGSDPGVVWCTGPSKTADVEGILIEGVHGPGELVALVTSP